MLNELQKIFAQYDRGFEHQVDAALAFGIKHLKLDIGILAKIDGQRYTVHRTCAPPSIPLSNGDVFSLGDTFCAQTIEQDHTVIIPNVSASHMHAHPAYKNFGLEAYIGIPVRLNNRVWGTLNFSSRTPHHDPFNKNDVDVFELLAVWIGGELHKMQLEQFRAQAQRSLQKNEQRLEIAAWAADVGVWDWDMVTNETVFSDHWYGMLGYIPGELPMNIDSWIKVCHPDDLPRSQAAITEHADGHTPEYRIELRVQRKDGSWMWTQDVGRVVERDDQGNPTRMVGVHFNIDRLKKIQDELSRNQLMLELFVEHAPAAIAMFDRDMNYLAASQRWRDDYQLGDQKLVGRSHYDVFPEIGEKWKDDHRRVLAGEVLSDPAEAFVRSDGRTDWVRWENHPWRNPDGSVGGIIMFTEVITDLVEIRLANDRQRRDLQTLLFVTSHDLNEPLRAITAFASLLRENDASNLSEVGKDYLQRIQNAGQRMTNLLDDITTLSRAERSEPKPQTTSVDRAVQQTLEQLAHLIDQRDTVVRVHRPLPDLRVDPFWLEQALQNLITNAIKFTAEGQAPEIDIEPFRMTIEQRILAPSHSGQIGLIIRDRGPGVPDELKDKIFTLFQRGVERDIPGTGAGLAIVARIAERHGGSAWVQDRPGGGSDFFFTVTR